MAWVQRPIKIFGEECHILFSIILGVIVLHVVVLSVVTPLQTLLLLSVWSQLQS
jgi:hypothetical protein